MARREPNTGERDDNPGDPFEDLWWQGAVIFQSAGTVLLSPAVVAVWVGWQLVPPIRRAGERVSGRHRQSPSPPGDPGHS